MKEVLEFLADLRLNNNRPWFEANKARYKEALAVFNAFTEELIEGIAAFDPAVRGLTLRDCTYRIYRDTRFSNDKTPYKTHMGAYVCPHGKKSGYAGYYFHIEPVGDGLLGGHLMTSGLYMPEPAVLRSVRYEIAENGAAFEKAMRKAKGFTLDQSNKLKRLPTGFTPGSPYDEYLKLKDVYMIKPMTDDYLLQPNLAAVAARDLATTYDLTAQLNKAVTYAFEENTDD